MIEDITVMDRKDNILIVDDSETNLVLLEAILEDDGFEVQKAYSAREAEGLLEKGIPDIMLLDLLMPNENGFDLLKKLKANSLVSTMANNVSAGFKMLKRGGISKATSITVFTLKSVLKELEHPREST